MSFVADLAAVGTALFTVAFSLWLLKELFKHN